MITARGLLFLGVLARVGVPGVVVAQGGPLSARHDARLLAAPAPAVVLGGEPGEASLQSAQGAEPRSPLGPAAFSLVLPGAGQHVLGHRRKWVYAALEVAGWVVFFERRAAGSDYQDRYRDFAWDHARIQTGPRIDGDFDYYETLTKWTTSGTFDADAMTPGLQPESDPTTYNGSIWVLAQQIFVPGGGPVPPTDPAYQRALEYYDLRAYHTEFLWDWSGAPGGMAEMGSLIESSDERFRQATTALGVVIANHVVSAVDAYLSARGRSAPASLSFAPESGPEGPAWRMMVSVPVGP